MSAKIKHMQVQDKTKIAELAAAGPEASLREALGEDRLAPMRVKMHEGGLLALGAILGAFERQSAVPNRMQRVQRCCGGGWVCLVRLVSKGGVPFSNCSNAFFCLSACRLYLRPDAYMHTHTKMNAIGLNWESKRFRVCANLL